MRTGAVFDFRIADIRSSAQIPGGESLIDRIRPVKSAAVFIMTPLWLHARSVNPDPKYIRLLEGRVWSDYLDRAPELSRRSRLVVRYWKPTGKANSQTNKASTADVHSSSNAEPAAPTPVESEAQGPVASDRHLEMYAKSSDSGESRTHLITTDNPMRVFAEFKIDSRRSRLGPAILGGIIVLAFALASTDLTLEAPMVSAVNSLVSIIKAVLTWVLMVIKEIGLGGGILGVVGIIVSLNVGFVMRWIRERLLLLEARVFHALRDLGPRD